MTIVQFALTSTVMKVFERLLKKHICSSIPATLDPLQFAYRPNRSTDDAISPGTALLPHSHRQHKMATMSGCYSLDYSSAFNTIVPTKLDCSTIRPRPNTSLCDWIQDFLTARPQVVKVGQFTIQPPSPLNHRSPTGLCPEPPAILSIYTRLRVLTQPPHLSLNLADDTVVLGLINNDDETAYLDEVERLTSWCRTTASL